MEETKPTRAQSAITGTQRRDADRTRHETDHEDGAKRRSGAMLQRLRARARGLVPVVRAALADSPWTPAVAKVLLGASVFVALALVGSGAALGWLPDPQPRAALAAVAAAPGAASASGAASSPMPVASAPDAGAPADPAAGGGVTPDGKVVLNLASEDDLRRLPGIGPGRARAILALRARLGRLKRPEDLLRVKGIGRKLLARLRPLVLVDAPAADPTPKTGG